MRRAAAAFALLACCFAAAPVAAAERAIAYADLHRVFSRVAMLQGGKYLRVATTLASKDPSIATRDIRLVIRSRQGDLLVPVAADGSTAFPLRADLLAENPAVMTNVPEGKLEMNVSLAVEAPPQQRFRYGLMAEMLAEAKAMIAKQGFVARLLAPDFEGLVITFAPGSETTVTVAAAAGPVRLTADASGNVLVPDRRDWRRENPWLELSALPTRIALRAD
jgi:hypothetical protein